MTTALLEEPQDFRRKDDGLIEITSIGIDRIIIVIDEIAVVVLRVR